MESLLSLKEEEQLLSLLALRGGGGGGSGDPPHLRVPVRHTYVHIITKYISNSFDFGFHISVHWCHSCKMCLQYNYGPRVSSYQCWGESRSGRSRACRRRRCTARPRARNMRARRTRGRKHTSVGNSGRAVTIRQSHLFFVGTREFLTDMYILCTHLLQGLGRINPKTDA